MISSFFATGTGRCGSQLFSKLFNASSHTHTNHEYSVKTLLMKESFYKKKPKILNKDVDRLLAPSISKFNKGGKAYGECSSHLYLLYPELFRRYGYSTRFMLLVRRPENFIRSALARGFFSPDHPNALEHVIAPRDTEIGARWNTASPLEKCSWYWSMVNGFVYQFFMTLPQSMFRIVRIEHTNMDVIEDLYAFLGLKDFNEVRHDLEGLLSVRHNATPGQGEDKNLNPYSKEVALGPLETWMPEQRSLLDKHTLPLASALYTEDEENAQFNELSVLK